MKKHILSLDGGGIRGLYMYELLILVSKSILPKTISKYCDLIVGTSVGAILAAALACDFIGHDNFDNHVRNAIKNVFSVKTESGILLEPMYNGRHKRRILNEIFGERTLGTVRCPLAIVACRMKDCSMRVFTSWKDPHLLIAEALDAASAAPTYFPPVRVDEFYYFDGGIICNSPIHVGILCLYEIFDGNQPCKLPFLALSIGCKRTEGKQEEISDPENFGLFRWLQFGIVSIFLGANNDSVVEFVKAVYGSECIIRIVGQVGSSFADTSEEYCNLLKKEAELTWLKEQDSILSFFQN
jgi:hypothetical protein